MRAVWTYLPRSGDVERFLKCADIAGITDQAKKIVDQSVRDQVRRAMMVVKLSFGVYVQSDPLVALAFVLLPEGLEHLLDKLHAEYKQRDASRELWELLRNKAYEVRDVGGPAHTQFGEFIRQKEESESRHLRKRFGGLSKWMNPDTHTFEWLCPVDAYNRIAQYRRLTTQVHST
jgi:hypothetical protein